MRRLLVSGTAAATLCVVAFALFPIGARAATARETFRQMKAAMAASKKTMEVKVQVVVEADGKVQATVTHDGQTGPTPMRVESNVERKGNEVIVKAKVSFDEGDYAKIAFGKNHNTLVLCPKKQPAMKYEVALDGESKLPLHWVAFAKRQDSWKRIGAYEFKYTPKPKAG